MANTNSPKYLQIVSTFGILTACFMYVSYIPQIMNNLNGHPTPPYQPAVAAINCILWVWYGTRVKNWPVAIANVPGVFFGIFAALTALIYR